MLNLYKSFPGQKSDEFVFVFLRRHPISFLFNGLIFGLMILLGLGLYILIFNLDFFRDQEVFNFGVLVVNSYLLASLAFTFVALLDFYLDIHIVTNARIVDIDQNRLFHRQIDELALEDVEDVSSIVSGIFGTFFNYGNVEIQTAGAKANFIFENVPNPREVAQLTLDLADQAQKGIASNNRFPTRDVYGVIGSSIVKDQNQMYEIKAWPTPPSSSTPTDNPLPPTVRDD